MQVSECLQVGVIGAVHQIYILLMLLAILRTNMVCLFYPQNPLLIN